ncbi:MULTISPECIES: thioesterase family protein [Modicisalibacter]|uniref:thioesterase family protein n=1 Tax=Modicisalibacter TaxID=574347 RepID=UPI00100B215C|nr:MULTISPECIES: thioesterase family protein [Halomonadaceae]MBZ9557556.1 thioesterase family protein [Modicisalibacter sp. R2A 31.J]MBZ9573779.1 thioesterase family protein [Modicisalibacter sp. MOD 31.J]
MRVLETRVAPEWVDYNGHMNDAAYARVFSLAVEALMERLDLGEAGRRRHAYTLYTLETHLCYRREAHRDQPLVVSVRVLDRDAKRLHLFFTLDDVDGQCLATSEQMLMGMATDSGRPGPFPRDVEACIAGLPGCDPADWPTLAGRRIGIPRRGDAAS